MAAERGKELSRFLLILEIYFLEVRETWRVRDLLYEPINSLSLF